MDLEERAKIFKIVSTVLADKLGIEVSTGCDTEIFIYDKDRSYNEDGTVSRVSLDGDMYDLLTFIDKDKMYSISDNFDNNFFNFCHDLISNSKTREINWNSKSKEELYKYASKMGTHGKVKFKVNNEGAFAEVKYHITDNYMCIETYSFNKDKARYEKIRTNYKYV